MKFLSFKKRLKLWREHLLGERLLFLCKNFFFCRWLLRSYVWEVLFGQCTDIEDMSFRLITIFLAYSKLFEYLLGLWGLFYGSWELLLLFPILIRRCTHCLRYLCWFLDFKWLRFRCHWLPLYIIYLRTTLQLSLG